MKAKRVQNVEASASRVDANRVRAKLQEGVSLHKRGELAQAKAIYEQILEMQAHHFEALHLLGVIAAQTGNPSQAVKLIGKAIEIDPNNAAAYSNRGNALRDLKLPQAALESYDRAIALKPDYADAFNNRGNALQDLEQPRAALESYDRAIALRPGYAEAFNNRGNALRDLERPQAALESYDRAIALRPDFTVAFSDRGTVLRDLKQPQAALDSYDKAIALKPDYEEAYSNKALCLLLLGRFDEGWRHYEWRKQRVEPAEAKTYYQPIWLGQEDIAGKTLFIHSEQGLGDTIQFCRYVKLAEARGARVVLSAQDPLMRLLRQLSPTVEIVGSRIVPLHFDYYTPLLSMPLAFKTDQNNIPAQIPYLRAEAHRVERWKDRIGQDGFKIGIAWQGSRAKVDLGRSFSVTNFSAISRLPNVRLISLQKNAGVEQLSDLPPGMKVETLGADFDAGPDAFIDTAAVMDSLNLIITSDTSIAHLAGALGRPTWVALKHVPDWRWQLERTDSPWYPTTRLFRQTSRDDWAGVFAEMQMHLARNLTPADNNLHMPNPSPTPRVPVSWGELIDKITILEIKRERLTSKGALANVCSELAALDATVRTAHEGNPSLDSLKSHLKTINEALWEIENKIRMKEALKSFDQEFIELARAVYVRNDARGRVKRQINDLLGSEFVEEKQYTVYT